MRQISVVLALLALLWTAPAHAQHMSDLDQYLGPDGAAYWALQCRYRGAEEACAAITNEIEQRWVDSCPERTRPIPYGALQIIRYRLDFEPTNQGRNLTHATGVWTPCAVPDVTAPPTEVPPPSAQGRVRLNNRAFADDDGPFLGFGATYMSALHRERVDRRGLRANLGWLADRGVNYIRILSMVGAQPYWQGRVIDPRRAGYFNTFTDLIADARNAGTAVEGQSPPGLRLQVVLFADAQVMMPAQAGRLAWVDRVATFLEPYRDTIQFVEIANESQLNGIEDHELAALTRRWKERSKILVAPSSPNGSANAEEGIEQLFREQTLTVDLLTPHFQRNNWEEGYRHWRQPWEVQFYNEPETTVFVSNEPMGPGKGDNNPSRLAIGMATTFIARGAGWVLHTEPGVRGRYDFWKEPGIEPVMSALRYVVAVLPANLPNGRPCSHHWACHPYGNLDQIWPDHDGTGVSRVYASEVDGVFYAAVMAMRERYDIRAEWPMTIEVFDLCTQQRTAIVHLNEGQRHTFRVTPCRDFIHRVARRF